MQNYNCGGYKYKMGFMELKSRCSFWDLEEESITSTLPASRSSWLLPPSSKCITTISASVVTSFSLIFWFLFIKIFVITLGPPGKFRIIFLLQDPQLSHICKIPLPWKISCTKWVWAAKTNIVPDLKWSDLQFFNFILVWKRYQFRKKQNKTYFQF